jgi:hypothetical protein
MTFLFIAKSVVIGLMSLDWLVIARGAWPSWTTLYDH